jgi:hypothetical protein
MCESTALSKKDRQASVRRALYRNHLEDGIKWRGSRLASRALGFSARDRPFADQRSVPMTEAVQMECINKSDRPNPHEGILDVGGIHGGRRWKLRQQEAMAGIDAGKGSAKDRARW